MRHRDHIDPTCGRRCLYHPSHRSKTCASRCWRLGERCPNGSSASHRRSREQPRPCLWLSDWDPRAESAVLNFVSDAYLGGGSPRLSSRAPVRCPASGVHLTPRSMRRTGSFK